MWKYDLQFPPTGGDGSAAVQPIQELLDSGEEGQIFTTTQDGAVWQDAPFADTETVEAIRSDVELLSALLTDPGELTYQWQYRLNETDGARASTADDATTDALSITIKSYRDGYQYRLMVTDADGAMSYTPWATLHVDADGTAENLCQSQTVISGNKAMTISDTDFYGVANSTYTLTGSVSKINLVTSINGETGAVTV